MIPRTAILFALLVAGAPLALAHNGAGPHDPHGGSPGEVSPNPVCDPVQNPHDYVGSGSTYTVSDGNTCDLDGNGFPDDFDGDYEFGLGGAFLPAGPWAADPTCDYGLTPHHIPEIHVTSVVPAEDHTPGSPTYLVASFTVGSDPTPPTLVPSADPGDDDGFDCVTDGAVTPDLDTDDCIESFAHFGTTVCLPGGDGGWHVWVDPPAQSGHVYTGGADGGAPGQTFPSGHITIHKWPGANGVTGEPTILVLPPGWSCTKVVNGVSSAAAVGHTLPNSGDKVRCAPPGAATNLCQSVSAYGYAASAGSGSTVTVTAACTGLATAAAFTTPAGAGTSSNSGLGAFPFQCIPTWSGINAQDDWWVHCQVN